MDECGFRASKAYPPPWAAKVDARIPNENDIDLEPQGVFYLSLFTFYF